MNTDIRLIFYLWFNYLSHVGLQTIYSVGSDDKPQFESSKSSAERNAPMLYSAQRLGTIFI